MRHRYVGGSITKSSKGKTTLEVTNGNFESYAAKQNIWWGTNGTTEHDYAASEKKEKDKKKATEEGVKEIELLTPLDEGSANDQSGKLQLGMIFGKAYQFKVKSYVKDTPKDKSVIKWGLKYHSLSENKWIEIPLAIKGDSVKITMNEEDMCGRFAYIRAYINDSETEGELKVWKHNRFRWFDGMVVEEEIKDRTDNKKPWLVNQAGTSLCGMACIFYVFAKEQPQAYKKFAKELFRTGEATFNKYTVKPSIEVLEKKADTIKIGAGTVTKTFVLNTGQMPLVDYITMASARNTDNPSYKGGDEEFQAINWPKVMTKLFEELLGYNDITSKGIYNPIKPLIYTEYAIDTKIENINNQIRNGYRVILMIDADLINDVWDMSSLDLHWVVLESEIKKVQMLNKNGQIENGLDFSVYTWGTNPFDSKRYLKKPISKNHFMNNYNGYIKIK